MRFSFLFLLIAARIVFTSNVHGQQNKNTSINADRYINAHRAYSEIECPISDDEIKHFAYFIREREKIRDHSFLKINQFDGAQIVYAWEQLEPEKDQYDFSIISEDLEYLRSYGKKLWIQLQDASFTFEYKPLPDYLLTTEYDGGASIQYNDGGESMGWVAKRWNKKVQERFSMLLEAMGKEFDGKIEGINLQETAIGVRNETDSSFNTDLYVKSLKVNMMSLKKAFTISATMQYANFTPGEWLPWNNKGYLKSIYEFGQEIGVGLGGPDLMYLKRGQLNHTIAMMHESEYTVPLGIAIQDGNYIGKTASMEIIRDRDNLVPKLHTFAKDFLKVNYMFWVIQEPYFSEDVIPCFSSN